MVSHFYFWMLVIIYYLIFSPFHFWFWCWYKCDSCLKLVDVWGLVGMQKCQYYPPTTGTPDALRNSTKKEWKLVFSNFHFQILPKSGKTCFPISFSSHCIDICWNSAETKNNSNYVYFPIYFSCFPNFPPKSLHLALYIKLLHSHRHQCNVSKEKHLKLHNIWLDNKKVSNESFVKIWRWCYIEGIILDS